MKKVFAGLIMIMAAFLIAATSPALSEAAAPPALEEAKQKIGAEFDRLDAGLKQAAQTLGATGLTGREARSVLNRLCLEFDYAVDCAAVDLQGKMVTIEPVSFHQFEGKDISDQQQIKQILKDGKPVLSNVFRAVEGFPAADAEYPVVTPAGVRLGSVSLLFQPEKLLGKILVPLLEGTTVDIWVMEKGGLILYDVDQAQIGLNLFTARLYRPYPALIALGRRIAAAREGNGVYEFKRGPTSKAVRKKAFWKSVSLYGNVWRLVAVHVEQKDKMRRTGILISSETTEQKLESLAANAALVKAMSAGDEKKILQFLKNFYEETPGIYSVQWLDEKGVNRFGYPVENSFVDYNYHVRKAPSDEHFLKILSERKPAEHEQLLFEGRTGKFTFRPVYDHDRYMGLVYYITVKK